MRRQQVWPAFLALPGLLLVAGCWNDQMARDTYPVKPPTRPNVDNKVIEENGTGVIPLDIQLEKDLLAKVLPGPLATFVRRNAPSLAFVPDRAVIRIELPSGDALSHPGLAEMAARAVSDLPLGAGQASMRETITGIGGELHVSIGTTRTSFTATVPPDQRTMALKTMVTHLQRSKLTRTQFDQLRHLTIQRELDSRRNRPLLNLVGHLIRERRVDPNRYLHQVEDSALPQLSLLLGQWFQPRFVAVGLWVPGNKEPDQLVKEATAELANWRSGATKVTPLPPPEPVPAGIFWAEGDGPVRVALVFRASDRPALAVIQDVLSQGGVGGRLGLRLRDALGYEPAFRAHRLGSFQQRYLVLETAVTADKVLTVWRAMHAARTSLVRERPRGTELKTAIERMRLRYLSRQAQPGDWFEAASVRAMDLRSDGPAHDLYEINRLRVQDVGKAVPDFVRLPVAMVVIGGKAPTEAGINVARVDARIPKGHEPTEPRPRSQREADGKNHADHAVRAVGGQELLKPLVGFHASYERRVRKMLSTEERTLFKLPNKLRRVTKVLDTELETVVEGDRGFEIAGADQQRLAPGQAQRLWTEAARHPLVLLAQVARGETRYQLVAMRKIKGRQLALLERIAPKQLRLRMLVDAGSGLPRMVESWERRPGIGLVEITEIYDDYRNVAGLRVPHRRQTLINDVGPIVETLWKNFVAKPPTDAQLQAGGSLEPGK